MIPDPKVPQFELGEFFRLYREPDMNYRMKIWSDLFGDSFHGIPDTPAKRKWLAAKLREAARWVERGK